MGRTSVSRYLLKFCGEVKQKVSKGRFCDVTCHGLKGFFSCYIRSEQRNTTSINMLLRTDVGFHQSVHHVHMYSMRHTVPATQIRGQLDNTAFLMSLIIQKTEKLTKTLRNQGNITVTEKKGGELKGNWRNKKRKDEMFCYEETPQ